MRTTLILCCFVLGCGGDDGGGGSADAATAPATITVSGEASKREGTNSSPAAGVNVAAYNKTDANTPVATATTDSAGMYSMTITTDGVAVDGYLKATLAGFLDTYLYPPRPLSADFDSASLNILNQDTLDLLSNLLCGNEQDPAKGVVAVLVVDAADMPVAGATVTATPTPGKICYNSGGFPSGGATMTDTDGIAYVLNIAPGDVTVTATKTGITYRQQKLNARAGVFTTTPIQP